MKYGYDEEKAKSNKKKHKIDFEEAITIFEDQHLLIKEDTRHSKGEERYIALGFSKEKNCLFVIFCEYKDEWGENLRIISARHAEKFEEKIYQSAKTGGKRLR